MLDVAAKPRGKAFCVARDSPTEDKWERDATLKLETPTKRAATPTATGFELVWYLQNRGGTT